MDWQVRYTKTFYKELAKIPERIRQQIEGFAFGNAVQENPSSAGRVEKLKGYDDFYKVRFGSYRLGLRIDQENQVVEFRRVRHRQDIYRKFP
ncbi:type II toxin-antitoxin system RelE family toxin [Nodosilinea sp. AN01ver1]|uniref:type II toxin-antitoxin system RelE family toxin n=1 Tax=Nodosilinea sp. AN01ver1 TaxID=3423362 RepID=UPI003D321F3D